MERSVAIGVGAAAAAGEVAPSEPRLRLVSSVLRDPFVGNEKNIGPYKPSSAHSASGMGCVAKCPLLKIM